MTDVFPKEKRSWIMGRVHGENTSLELKVRSLVHRLGYRFRLYRSDLPGKPDLVFVSKRKVIFIHGCFWHGHTCTRGDRIPKTNEEYWRNKINNNKIRDEKYTYMLRELGWETLVIWECQVKDLDLLKSILASFLK